MRAHLLDQKFLCGRRVLLRLYLVPLRQSRDLAVGEMTDWQMTRHLSSHGNYIYVFNARFEESRSTRLQA
jgi:hypothetical protein